MTSAPAGLVALVVCWGIVSTLPGVAAAQEREVRARQAELEQLRASLEALRDGLQKDLRKRDVLGARLRDAEKQEAAANARLSGIRSDQADNRARRKTLQDRRQEQERALESEREVLSGQVRSAFVNGRGERLKLLLNQEDPSGLGRQMVYYAYLNRARSERIQAVLSRLAQIAALDEELAGVAARLAELEDDAEKELAAHARARKERSAVLAEIERRIGERGAEISRLESEESALRELIRELRAVMRDFPVQGEQPFIALKGKLSWPVAGQLVSDYGKLRAGETIRWNGVVVAADRGSPVRAVARGRVTYADWLPGLGLLVILDHGGGYLSLYGHNDTINRNVGDWVRPGDIISTVGDSGGRPGTGLYFEIRQGMQPQNPHRWFGSALKRR